MSKIIITIFLVLSIFIFQQINAQTLYHPDSLNQTMIDTSINQEVMIGKYTYQGVLNSPVFKTYIDEAIEEYTPYDDFLVDYKDSLNKISITIVFGSWCSDSQYEVPRMLMLLKSLDYPMEKLNIMAVDRHKEIPDIDIKELYIEYVPTFIFNKDKYEVGRIIEHASESLEADIASFLFYH